MAIEFQLIKKILYQLERKHWNPVKDISDGFVEPEVSNKDVTQ